MTYPFEPPPEFGGSTAALEAPVPQPRPWAWWGALLLVLAALLAQIVAGILAYIGMEAASLFSDSAALDRWNVPLLALSGSLSMLLLLVAVRRRAGAKPLWDSRDLKDWRSWVLALAVLLVSAGANIARIVLERDPAAPDLNMGILELVQKSPSIPWWPLLTLGVTVVVLAPLTEEWLFRGILLPAIQRAFGRRWPWLGTWVAVPVSSLIFGLLHWPIWWVPAVYGAAIGLLSLRQRSLAVPMLVHGMINLTVFLLVLSAA